VNVGISGPGVVRAVRERAAARGRPDRGCRAIKATSLRSRAGRARRREAARATRRGDGPSVDLSLAPTPAECGQQSRHPRSDGLERCGAPDHSCAGAFLNDRRQEGGAMGTSSIAARRAPSSPVSEGTRHVCARRGWRRSRWRSSKAMTAVCRWGWTLIAIPATRSAETIAAIIRGRLRQSAWIDHKTTALAPHPRSRAKRPEIRDVPSGGLLAPVMK